MRNKSLERKIELLKEFIEEWMGFKDFLKGALEDKAISAEGEKEFLEIKSLIARKYQGLTRSLAKDFVPDEKLMDIISHAVSLESLAGDSSLQFRKIENDWHLSYIHLNTLLGNLESEKDRLSRISKTSVALNCFTKGVKRFYRKMLKVILILVFLAVIGLVGSYFLPGGENKEEGLLNYLVTTVKNIVTTNDEAQMTNDE